MLGLQTSRLDGLQSRFLAWTELQPYSSGPPVAQVLEEMEADGQLAAAAEAIKAFVAGG